MESFRRISARPRPCSGRRVSAKKRPRADELVNSVSKLQRREICSKPSRPFSTIGHHEKFRHIRLQVISSIHGCIVSFVVTWRLSMPMKHRDFLLEGSPWTFPTANDFLNSRTNFGFIGSANVLFPFGIYSRVLFFSVIGAILLPFPVWFLSRKFPEKKWIKTINFPSLFLGASMAPFVTPVRFWTWFIIGITLNSVIYRKYKKWWGKYNYVFSIGLDVGITVMALLANVTLLGNGVSGIKWWGFHLNDHCPLAGCPTESDVNVEGCPTFHS